MSEKDTVQRPSNLDAIITQLMADTGSRFEIPDDLMDKQRLMRALMNVRQPNPATGDFLQRQDRELQCQLEDKGIVEPKGNGLQVWQGDITRLKVDAIVNAANSQLLGCFIPLHGCIDNSIHSAAGIQLREACNHIMQAQRHEETTGMAKITPGFNLPAKYVIHTVGPVVPNGQPTREQEEQLGSCYRSCLVLAEEYGLHSIAFCCISTGVFRFPRQRAAEIAVFVARHFPRKNINTILFNTFKNEDTIIYRQLVEEANSGEAFV
jgi:O-acetyl-ADP-ribose deacetylase (regulator of RNase III)